MAPSVGKPRRRGTTGLATVGVDILAIYVLPKKGFYNRAKYQKVSEKDDVEEQSRQEKSGIKGAPTKPAASEGSSEGTHAPSYGAIDSVDQAKERR